MQEYQELAYPEIVQDRSHIVRSSTANRLWLKHVVADSDNPFGQRFLDGFNDLREILQDELAREVWEMLFKCRDIVAHAATNINQQNLVWGNPQPFLYRINFEPVCTTILLALRHHRVERLLFCGILAQPFKVMALSVVGELEGSIICVFRVRVVIQFKIIK